jgi:guanyl-specific ribonuclease Sa
MPVRYITRLLLLLYVTFLLHLGVSFANDPGPALLDQPTPQLAPVPSHAPQPQNGSARAGPDQKAPGARQTIPDTARETLQAIEARQGEPLPGYVGGRPFQNREHKLPRGRYREYDVHPKVPGKHRGAERIVIEQRSGKAYYTADHYNSFVPMN